MREENALLVDGRRVARRLQALGVAGRVLDAGAGDGWHALALGDAGFEVTALEPNAARRDLCRLRSGARCDSGFFDEAYARAHEGAFDCVLLSQVMEHLADVGMTASHIHRVLRPQGTAVVAVPRFRSWQSRLQGRRDMFITPPEHLTYFTPDGLTALMDRCGLELIEWETVTWFEPSRLSRRLRSRTLGAMATMLLRSGFAMADRSRHGNTLEAYFRRR